MTLLAVTVIGADRPGIIADVTGVLAGLGANLEDSSMTLLGGHFAWMLVCSAEGSAADVEAALSPLTDGGQLIVSVREIEPEPAVEDAGAAYVVSVHGGDRPGILSAVTSVLARAGGNVTDLSTRLAGELFVVVAEVDVPASADVAALGAELAAVARQVGVDVTMRAQDTDVL